MPLPWLALLAACDGPQSALAPAGRDAEQVYEMLVWMSAVGLLAWVVVVAIGLRALGPAPKDPQRAQRMLVGLGGIVIPTALLTALLAAGLPALPGMLDPGPGSGLSISMHGEQFWWRVRYRDALGTVELANELRIPVGQRTPLVLESPDVIHSLWIPSLAGKMDLVPGRVNRMALEPTRTGTFRGACAEFCGLSHAHMALWAVVLEPAEFASWLARERLPARAPTDPVAQRGAELFLANGCGACHTVRGTAASGTLGPDLTHVGGRQSVAAGLLPNDAEGFRRWLEQTDTLKPGVRMPPFHMLGDADLDAIARYLDALE